MEVCSYSTWNFGFQEGRFQDMGLDSDVGGYESRLSYPHTKNCGMN